MTPFYQYNKTKLHREELENREKALLASYAMCSQDSRGRARGEPDSDGYRTLYQRDRDRIIHSKAFRRLAYKTQVQSLSRNDHVRTRLTHSLEVAQLGRTIARTLRCNEDLVEAICLAHDLGHAPFGHVGEKALHCLMHDVGGFNHNENSHRLITEVEEHRTGTLGLNLTYEVREGLVKHATVYDKPSSHADFNSNERSTLEAQISNIVDRIAYNASDLDDYVRIALQDEAPQAATQNAVEKLRRLTIYGYAQEYAPSLATAFLPSSKNRRHLISTIIDMTVRSCIDTTATQIRSSQVQSIDDVRNHGQDLVSQSDVMEEANEELQCFLMTEFYQHRKIRIYNMIGQEIIERLFNAYRKQPSLMPTEQQALLQDAPDDLIIGQYIASMSDRYLYQRAKELNLAQDYPAWTS